MFGNDLVIAEPKDPKYMKKIIDSVRRGSICLFRDVGEYLDPTLDNILAKNVTKVTASKSMVKVGEAEFEWSNKFRLFVTTRMSNPHYTPEISTKVAVVNFCVKESGLED